MPVPRWNPVQELLALRDRMNRLVEHVLSRSRPRTEFADGGAWSPEADLFESDESVVLRMEIPGVEQDAIQLLIVPNRITVRGERRLKETVSLKQFHRTERAFGPFSRTFSLPSPIDPERVEAELRKGVLNITMHRRGDENSRQIPIRS